MLGKKNTSSATIRDTTVGYGPRSVLWIEMSGSWGKIVSACFFCIFKVNIYLTKIYIYKNNFK